MTYFQQYNKPAQHVIVDLLNRTLVKHFHYDKVHVTYGAPIGAPKTTLLLPALDYSNRVREKSEFTASIDGYQNILRCSYHRLFLDRCLPRIYLKGTADSFSAELLLIKLFAKYDLFLAPEDVDVAIFGLVRDDGTQRATIVAKTNHLVWSGTLDVSLVPEDHIALSLQQFELGPLNFRAPPDIAQEVFEQMLGDLVLFQQE